MPSINDIVQVAEALEKCPVTVVRDRCIAVRNRNASCRRCVDACTFGAVTVSPNEIAVSPSACVGCGACVGACPTEALSLAESDAQSVRERGAASIEANDGIAAVACARIASKRQAAPERFAELPCLAAVDETLLITLAAAGAAQIDLIDGNCATCKHQSCMVASFDVLEDAERALALHGCATRLERMTGFPAEMRGEEAGESYGSTRRGFFTEAAGAARETVRTTAKATIENELGYAVSEQSIGARLRVTESGTMPQLDMPRHEAVLNALDRLGIPEQGTLDSRLFATVSIDASKCNACGMCAVFCPTGALVRNASDKPSDPIRFFEFSAADCVQCGLCVDVCWKEALVLSPRVDVAELYDFEPRTFPLK